MMYYYGGFWPFHMVGAVFMVIFWVLIIWGAIRLFRKTSHYRGGSHALDILKERYAKGEITKHEFETMKKDLSE